MQENEGENPFDIWPAPLTEEEVTKATENEGEKATADKPATQEKGTPEPDEFDKIADELDAVADGKESTNKVVKGLQRVISRKDREIAEQRQRQQLVEEAFARQQAELREIRENMAAQAEALKWNSTTLLDALEEDAAKDARLSLYQRGEEYRASLAKAQQQEQEVLARARAAAESQRQTAQQQQVQLPDQESLEQLIANAERDFESQLRAMAEENGVAPSDPRLDYGQKGEPLVPRLEAFRKSMKAASEAALEKDLQGVRGAAVTTRGANVDGSAPTLNTGMSALERGARARTEQARRVLGI